MDTYANIKHLKYAPKNWQHYSPHHEEINEAVNFEIIAIL